MAVKTWKVDVKGIDALLAGPDVTKWLRELAQVGLDYARSIAPVGATGNYLASLELVEGGADSQGRPVIGFGTDSYAWHWVEFGSAKNSPYRVLTNAAMAVTSQVEML